MASNDNKFLLQCSHCKNELDMESKSFPCLHSFCVTCLNQEVKGETNGNGQCSQCDEIGKLDQLTLSPILVSCLKYRQMESTEWKCDFCLEDVNESIVTNWCKNCEKFFCDACYRKHNGLTKGHFAIRLSTKNKEEIKEAILTDMCKSHDKIEDSFCKRCNMCLCDTCYISHLKDSDNCSSRPMSVEVEALKKQKSEGPTLLKEIYDLVKNLEEKKEKSQLYSEELEKECNSKCEELWQNNDSLIEELKEKTHEMCDELRRITKEQVKKWQKFLQETERMLKKLEIWRLNLQHLLKKGPKEKDIVLGVELVARNLESSSLEFHGKIKEPVVEWQLGIKFSDSWQKFLQNLQNEKIGSGFLDYTDSSIQLENQWNLPESNTRRLITSILVSNEDDHFFLADKSNCSIIELKESGELICELILKDKTGEKFRPTEMFFNSPDILAVNCQVCGRGKEKLFFLEREKFSRVLKIKKIIHKKRQNSSFSVCKIEKKILICNYWKFQIDFYTEKGDYIETIDIGESNEGCWPLIRSDPSTGNLWGATRDPCKICCFHKNGHKIKSIEIEEKIWDFFINKSGKIYFCNEEGIFELFPEKNLHKNLHKFQKKSEIWPKIFVSREKFFVCFQIHEKYLIKIFKFLD